MTEDGKKPGISAAVDQVVDTSVSPVEEAEQLALLPLDAPRPSSERGGRLPGEPRRRGRPEGSTNKSTAEWRDYLLAQYRSPLIVMAEAVCLPAEELAARLGCSVKEAFDRQMALADKLAPYMHQKQPIALDTGGAGLVSLILAAPAMVEVSEGRADGTVIDAEIVNDDKSEG